MDLDNNWSQKREKRKTESIFASTGQEILDEVTRAVNEGNYSGLAESLSERINGALYGAANGFAKKWNPSRQNSDGQAKDYHSGQNGNVYQRPQQYFMVQNINQRRGRHRHILGMIGSFFFGFLAIIFGVAMITFIINLSAIAAIVFLAFFIGNLYGFLHFRKLDKEGQRYSYLVEEYYHYGTMIGDREYFLIKDLAHMMLEQPGDTLQNLIDMKKYDMIPQASFDAQYTTVLLTNHARMLYQNALNSYRTEKANAETDKNNASAEENSHAAGSDADTYSDVQKILDDGDAYIRKIRAINNELPDTEPMSEKLCRLENVTSSIFAAVKRDPKKAKDLRRIMNYYLPTTEKLLDAYMDFWHSPSQSDQKKNTMAEIEQSVDTVCDGFERVLAKITEPDVMDISSDISVMKHMMEQDGMTEPDLKV
ncbi:MAG: 5-bromo-4-chloroindolyl phosphate hydrolysis family protein [Eubacteriales bacterium]|jgi:5-bromo-4-chloroindolyl phosphate hydrolysis protein